MTDHFNKLKQIIWGGAESSDTQIYGLLDCSRDERIHAELLRSNVDYYCLYPGVLSEALARVAPYLVKLDQKAGFSQWLLDTGWGDSWGIFVGVNSSKMFELLNHFRQLTRVRDEQGKVFYFRFYDPRVMRVYLPTCITKELHTVFGNVKKFYMEDQTGEHVLDFRFDGQSLNQRKIDVAIEIPCVNTVPQDVTC